MNRTLTAMAVKASQEFYDEAEAQGDDLFEQHRSEIIACAGAKAAAVLGRAAADLLSWEYTATADLPDGTYEATATVDGGPAYLRSQMGDDGTSLELVRPCAGCKQDRIDSIAHLAHLGSLLEQDAGIEEKAVQA